MRPAFVRRRALVPCAGLLALAIVTAQPARGAIQDRHAAEPDRVASRQSPDQGIPVPSTSAADREQRLAQKGLSAGSAVMIRIFKAESELELWLQKDARFELFASYPICFWSGTLGPKLREGDKQAPEGLYSVGSSQLRRRGRWPRSFDIGFPNALDRAQARTGSYLLLHGGCTSTGCYAMTNPVMDEIYALGAQALRQGQDRIQVHVFPFRMTDTNLAQHVDSAWHPFWLNLKDAYDVFERTRLPPNVSVCGRRYLVREAARPGESDAPGEAPAPLCEGDDKHRDPIPVLSTDRQSSSLHLRKHRKAASGQRSRRAAGRNARKAYAAARRARMAAHGRRTAH